MRFKATPERIARLPEWARDHITHLERRVREVESKLDGILEELPHGEEPDGVYVYGLASDSTGLAARRLPGHEVLVVSGRLRLTARVGNDGGVYLNASEGFAFYPQSSNAGTIHGGHDHEHPQKPRRMR
jgi:hypothetical protein